MSGKLARRVGVAISAVALCSTSMLSPVGAANTAYEHRVDTDDDGIADSREFAGRDRYGTAALLADRYVDDHGSVDTVIVASGASQVDAVAAAALAATERAPVLLTVPDRLSAVTAAWIDRNDVLDVIVVGGPAAVSSEVYDRLADVGLVDSISRIAGADRFETAALIADKTAAGAWCGSSDNAAFVVDGADIAAAAIVAPASAAMGIPVLLADSESGLPEATVQRIGDLDVDRVILVSTDGPQTTIEAALANHVSAVATATGNTAVASANFAELLVSDCADENNVNLEAAALATNPVDALAAALTLSDFDGSGIVPVLFADKSFGLEGLVGDWLEATPAVIDDRRTHFAVIALGGTAAVPAWLVADAVSAAATADALTVSIENVNAEDGSFDLLFSENVSVAEVAGVADESSETGKIGEFIEINGLPVHGEIVTVANEQPGGTTCGDASTLAQRFTVSGLSFRVDDLIEVVPSQAVKFGAAGDQRDLVSPRSHLVRAERAPARPTLKVTAIAGVGIWIDVNKPGVLDVTKITVDSNALTGTETVTETDDGLSNGGRIHIADTTLEAGDRVVVASGAFDSENDDTTSSTARATAVAPDKSFKATRVDVTVEHTKQASATFGSATDDNHKVHLAAVEGGSADGAHGNGWTVEAWSPTGYDADSETANVEVEADLKHKRIVVRFLSGTPTVADVVDAVSRVSALRGVIEASAGCGDGTAEVSAESATAVLGGDLTDPNTRGEITVVFSLVFSDHVQTKNAGLAAALDKLVDDSIADEPTADSNPHTAPDATVTVTFEGITDAAHIPDARSVEIPAGVVDGYGTDDTNTTEEESKNLAETVRVRIR